MKAEVIKEFNGVEDGSIYPRLIKVGEIITGDLARAEVANGRAVEVGAKAKKPPANKMLDGPERNKSLPVSQPAQASRKRTAKRSRKPE